MSIFVWSTFHQGKHQTYSHLIKCIRYDNAYAMHARVKRMIKNDDLGQTFSKVFNSRVLALMGLDKVHSKNHVRAECKIDDGSDEQEKPYNESMLMLLKVS